MTIKSVLWMIARPDYESLFSILDGLRLDGERRYWIERRETVGNNCDIEADAEQTSTGIEIVLQMSHNTLTRAGKYILLRSMHLKSELAHRELSDLDRRSLAL